MVFYIIGTASCDLSKDKEGVREEDRRGPEGMGKRQQQGGCSREESPRAKAPLTAHGAKNLPLGGTERVIPRIAKGAMIGRILGVAKAS